MPGAIFPKGSDKICFPMPITGASANLTSEDARQLLLRVSRRLQTG